MAQELFEDIRNFVTQGLWGQDEEDDNDFFPSTFACDAGCGSVFEGGSVCESTFGPRDMSVFQEKTVHYRRPAPPPIAAEARSKPIGPYKARPEDPIDVEVADYFGNNPEVYAMNRDFTRISSGKYYTHGRQIIVEKSSGILASDQLMVKDGPMRQPLADYLCNSESSAEYSGSVFQAKNALQSIPQASRMTFADTGSQYSRIEAMKVAKEQALVREEAAVRTNQGKNTEDLHAKYEKKLTTSGLAGLSASPQKQKALNETLSFMSQSSATPAPLGRPGLAPIGGFRPLGTQQAARSMRR